MWNIDLRRLFDVEVARNSGYIADPTFQSPVTSPEVSPAVQQAWDACLSEIRELAPVPAPDGIIFQVRAAAFDEAAASRAVVAAELLWSRCMRDSGVTRVSERPDEMFQLFANADAQTRGQDADGIAVVDAECRNHVGYRKVFWSEEAKAQLRLIHGK